MIFEGLYLLNYSTKKKTGCLTATPFARSTFWYLETQNLAIFFFSNVCYTPPHYCWEANSNEALSMHRLPRVPWKQADTTRVVLYIHCNKNWKLFYNLFPSFSTLGGSNERVSCWIITGSSTFCCSRRLLDKQLHQLPVIICNIWCLLLQSSSKTWVRSVLNTQIEITALWLNSQIFDTAP